MSKYTTQLRFIIEMTTIDNEDLSIRQRISLAAPKIFNFSFPIWEENYRQTLEEKILLHYFNKEIGLETVGLWKLYLEERLNLIMPYYNEMYQTIANKFNYLTDTNITETYTYKRQNIGTNTGSINSTTTDDGMDTFTSKQDQNGTENQTGTTHSLESDLPQANYANVDYGTKMVDGTQNNDITNNKSININSTNDTNNTTTIKQDTNSTNNVNINDNYDKTREGASGGRSLTEMMLEYRQSLINIDKLVIDELADLFMMIY